MSTLSSKARYYILAVSLLGLGAMLRELRDIGNVHSFLLLLACCVLAAPLQVLKIEGVTARTSYNLGWIVYGFAFLNLGTPAALLVVLVAHLVEWAWYRYPWYIQLFNVATFSIAFALADILYGRLVGAWTPPLVDNVLAISAVFALLTLLNHLLVGIVIYLARHQSFAESGVMAWEPMLVDFGLLGLGAIAAIVWQTNAPALLLVSVVVFMLYRALLVPALRRQTEVDPKTNVYNMAYFSTRIAEEFGRAQRTGRPLALVMADLDHLREINNVYGHLAGDRAIQAVAACLVQHGRTHDVVARFGGEEFVILMPGLRGDEAMLVVETMRSAIEALALSSGDGAFRVTMSFGVSDCGALLSQTSKELIEQADQALYLAKRQGRNRACLYTHGLEGEPPSAPPTTAAAPESARPHGMTQPLPQADCTPLPADGPAAAPADAAVAAKPRAWLLQAYVGALALATCALAYALLGLPSTYTWLGIGVFALLAIGAELANLEIYTKGAFVSTAAAPLLAGVLLFGAPAAIVIGISIAAVVWMKSRSPLLRFWFNACNHTLSGLLCVVLLAALGRPLAELPLLAQVTVAVACALVLFLSSTVLVAIAMALSSAQRWTAIWLEQFRWLGLHYIALAFVAYGLVASYPTVGPLGIVIVLLPLALIRNSQKQYITATESMVGKLRQVNADLLRQKQAVDQLNDEMLCLLAAALDLRDPSVQSHSEQVARYATAIARDLGLSTAQVEQVRRAALLHDIGKLAVPDSVLYKAAPLAPDEIVAIRQHPIIGADLLARFRSFHAVTDCVRHHHEHYDGTGYPDGLAGNEISLEARIVGLADAVEAMASARPYQPALPVASITAELQRCAGTQFDPEIVTTFFAILERQGDGVLVDSTRSTRSWHESQLRTMQPCMPAATS
jgi:diguanylate cyclase (GGDEF)-like protein/putative nucleotidyltransferase with HDIG domain